MTAPTIRDTALALADLYEQKNAAYGDSIGKSIEALKLAFPEGIHPDCYLDAILFTRHFDKLCHLSHSSDPLGEEPRLDQAGYSLYALHAAQVLKKERTTWQGAANDQSVKPATHAKATPDSAAQPAARSTNESPCVRSETTNSLSPEESSANTSALDSITTSSAPAPTVQERAGRDAGDRRASEAHHDQEAR